MKSKNIKLGFVITILILSIIQVASASIWYSDVYNVIFVENEPAVNITDIYGALHDDSLLKPIGNKVWLVTAGIYSQNSTIYINSSDVFELRSSTKDKIIYGWDVSDNFRIYNVTITGWNASANKPERLAGVRLYNPELHDVTFKYVRGVRVYDDVRGDLLNITLLNSADFWLENLSNTNIYDIQIINGSPESNAGLYVYKSNNLVIHDITLTNITRLNGFILEQVNNSIIHDISIEHVGNSQIEGSAGLGLILSKGYNNHAYNIYINDTGWSGLGPTGNENSSLIENITIRNYGHNGLDIHPANNLIVRNISIYDVVRGNGIMITAGYYRGKPGVNITIEDAYINGAGVVADTDIHNVVLKNFTIINSGIGMGDVIDAKIINTTLVDTTGYSGEYNRNSILAFYELNGIKCTNCYAIDTSVYTISAWEAYQFPDSIKMINVNYTDLYDLSKSPIFYYYPDILVKTSSDIPVPDSTLTFINEINSSISSVNGWGDNKTTFTTTSSGHTPLPNQDRTNSPAIADYYRNSKGIYHQFSHTATITTPTGATVTLSGITPDSSWYRSNPNIPTYTITAIVPTGSTGPHITGFAPSEDNPFNTGESKIFRIWTDESLNSMEWYLDGTLVSQDSLTYTWSVTDGNHTIEFKGSNTNGTVTHRWDINGGFGLDLPPTAFAGPDITTYPGDIITFDGSGSTDDNGIISYVWDFDSSDGLQEDATGQVVSHTYSTPGIYTVTLTVSDTNGSTDSDTAIITVNEPATSINKDPVPPEYWNYYNGAGSGDWGRTTDEAHSGSYSAFLQGTGYSSSNYLNIGLVVGDSNGYSGLNAYNAIPGKTYNVSFWIKGDFNYVDVVAMTWNTEDGSSGRNWIPTSFGTINPDNIWTKYQGTFTTPSDAKKLVLIFKVMGDSSQTNLGTIYVDDVEINGSGNIILNPGAENSYTNNAPVLNPIGPKSIREGSPLQFTITATDPDNDPLTYSATGLPTGASLDATSGVFTWTPSDGQAGTHVVTFVVSDGSLTDSEVVTITVNETNQAPVLASIGPRSIDEGSPLTFTVSATDADGDSLTYSATGLPGGATFDPANRTFSWTPADGQAGLYTVHFEVTDGALTDSEDVMITVYEAEVEVTVPLYKGWNLISLPVINNTFTASTLANAIGGVTHVMKRSTTTDDYVDYIVGFSGAGDDFVISPDEGYYVYMENEKNFTFKGTQPGTRTIDLVEGWNLIGWTSLNSSDAVSAFVNPLSSTIKYAAKRNSPYGGYEKYVAGFSDPADNFNVEPGYGYFVYVTANSTLIHS